MLALSSAYPFEWLQRCCLDIILNLSAGSDVAKALLCGKPLLDTAEDPYADQAADDQSAPV